MGNETSGKKYKRRSYFLRQSNQGRLIKKLYLVLLAFMILSAILFYFISHRELTDEYYRAHSIIRSTTELLLPWVLAGIGLNIILVLFSMVLYTHSIAGPTFCILRDLKAVREGDLTRRFRVRRKDELQEVVRDLNDLMEITQQRFQAFERAGEMMGTLTQSLQELAAADKGDGSLVEGSLTQAQDIRVRLQEGLKGLKVS